MVVKVKFAPKHMRKTTVKALLEEAGFVLHPDSRFGDFYRLVLNDDFNVLAVASFKGNFLDRSDDDFDFYQQVDLRLEQGGQEHRCFNLRALQESLQPILEDLKEVAADPSVITCPKCRSRYVEVKTKIRGTGGEFLSCKGWDEKIGRGAKDRACNGALNNMQASFEYR